MITLKQPHGILRHEGKAELESPCLLDCRQDMIIAWAPAKTNV